MKSPDRWLRIMCIILVALLVVTLTVLREELFCGAEEQTKGETDEVKTTAAPMVMPTDTQKHEYLGQEFNYELNMASISTFPKGYNYADLFWFEITPLEWDGYTELSL